MKLSDVMNSAVVTLPPDATVAEAAVAMAKGKIRHLVVTGTRQQVLGVVSAGDLRFATDVARLGDLMSSPAVTATPGTDLAAAARLLRRREVGCLPVVERGRLAGIVTVSDLLGLLGKGALRPQPRTVAWTLPKRGPTHRPQPRRA